MSPKKLIVAFPVPQVSPKVKVPTLLYIESLLRRQIPMSCLNIKDREFLAEIYPPNPMILPKFNAISSPKIINDTFMEFRH
ncbi:hypothetical protein Sjap_011805 [Stephania japonica]|uniref:Uncharacterized protein n=1 Tax=Stephania japonica TaxID=461633 RepID=A0AAP0P5B7_9MAGN